MRSFNGFMVSKGHYRPLGSVFIRLTFLEVVSARYSDIKFGKQFYPLTRDLVKTAIQLEISRL